MTDSTPEITLDQFVTERDGGAFVLDVREPDEYVAGHVPGAVLIPMGQVHDRVAEIPEGERILVICRSGRRSLDSTDLLLAHGYDAVSVAGGTNAWIEAGHPYDTGE